MKIYVYLDESGSIHKNSNSPYFAVGGYFVLKDEKNKVISKYKKRNKSMKEKRHADRNTEIKAIHMNKQEKIDLFREVQDISSFIAVAKVFQKQIMKKEIMESNIFFNYAVKLLFNDCILSLINYKRIPNLDFIVSIDNRNIRVGDLKNLENYLNTEFCLESIHFSITYYDSASHFGIQLADLVVNTFYNAYKNREKVKDVLAILKNKNYRVSTFPGHHIKGRRMKITVK